MITQKAISAKINCDLLRDLDEEVRLGYSKRNSIINSAVRLYLLYIDTRRSMRAIRDRCYQKKILEEFMREWFPECYSL